MQFAYSPKRSTEDAIATTLHEIGQHLDKLSTYVRFLFIDYSSAFNTIQPSILLDKLSNYNVPANLQLWILDFLTNRKQRVRTKYETSEYITINTGAPQGCVLSAFLFTIYTNDMSMNNQDCKIIKYADDTAVIGLINNCDESKYRDTVQYIMNWCDRCKLDLNVNKTKELVHDFRKNKAAITPLFIGDETEIV